jgi:hypothetical protein
MKWYGIATSGLSQPWTVSGHEGRDRGASAGNPGLHVLYNVLPLLARESLGLGVGHAEVLKPSSDSYWYPFPLVDSSHQLNEQDPRDDQYVPWSPREGSDTAPKESFHSHGHSPSPPQDLFVGALSQFSPPRATNTCWLRGRPTTEGFCVSQGSPSPKGCSSQSSQGNLSLLPFVLEPWTPGLAWKDNDPRSLSHRGRI